MTLAICLMKVGKKKELSKKISTEIFDEIYTLAIKNGALGGKILGAGGGGFFLFYVDENKIPNFLKNLIIILLFHLNLKTRDPR